MYLGNLCTTDINVFLKNNILTKCTIDQQKIENPCHFIAKLLQKYATDEIGSTF